MTLVELLISIREQLHRNTSVKVQISQINTFLQRSNLRLLFTHTGQQQDHVSSDNTRHNLFQILPHIPIPSPGC